MFRKSFLYLLPTSLILFSCILALPREAVEPIGPAGVEEPTPVPLEQAKITPTFDLPDTPTPVPTATPTEVAQDLVVPVQVNDFIYLQSESERQILQRAVVDGFGRALSASTAIENSANYKTLMPDHKGGTILAYAQSIFELRPSPSGKLVALISGSEVGHHVDLYNFRTGEIFPLLRAGGATRGFAGRFLGWSADSQSILYRADYGEPGVWLVDVETGSYQFLEEIRLADVGDISPAGNRVIYGDRRIENDVRITKVWLMNLETKEKKLLFNALGSLTDLTWSPDGHRVAYVGDCSKEAGVMVEGLKGDYLLHHGLCLMNPDGTNRHLLSISRPHGYLRWSPDSQRMVFHTLDNPPTKPPEEGNINWGEQAFIGTNIHIIDINTGTDQLLISDSTEGNIDPTWSPDGSQIIFASKRSGQSEIWMINADGTNLRQLTFDGHLKRLPVWSNQ